MRTRNWRLESAAVILIAMAGIFVLIIMQLAPKSINPIEFMRLVVMTAGGAAGIGVASS